MSGDVRGGGKETAAARRWPAARMVAVAVAPAMEAEAM